MEKYIYQLVIQSKMLSKCKNFFQPVILRYKNMYQFLISIAKNENLKFSMAQRAIIN